MKRIVLTGGGTGGPRHAEPGAHPRLLADGWDVHYIGEADGVEKRLIAAIPQVTYHSVSTGKLRRYFDPKNFTDPFKVVKGVGQASKLMKQLKPDVVFSKGGFVSVPVVYGARLHKVPVLLHESDMTPGLANKLCAPFARKILCTFPEAARGFGEKGVYTGTPIRPEILSGDREKGLATFGFTDGRPGADGHGRLLRGAGHQRRRARGAAEAVWNRFQVLHLCGPGNADEAASGHAGLRPVRVPERRNGRRLRLRQHTDLPRRVEHVVRDPRPAQAGAAHSLSHGGQPRRPDRQRPLVRERAGLSRVLMQEDMTAERLVSEVISLYRERGTLYEKMDKEPSANGVDNVLKEIYAVAGR